MGGQEFFSPFNVSPENLYKVVIQIDSFAVRPKHQYFHFCSLSSIVKVTEAVIHRFSSKQMFLKFLQNYRQTPEPGGFFKKGTPTQVFHMYLALFLRTSSFTEHLRKTDLKLKRFSFVQHHIRLLLK